MILVPASTEEQKDCWEKYPVKVMIGTKSDNLLDQCNDLFYIEDGKSVRVSLKELIKCAQKFKDFRKLNIETLDMDLFIVVGNLNYGLGVDE